MQAKPDFEVIKRDHQGVPVVKIVFWGPTLAGKTTALTITKVLKSLEDPENVKISSSIKKLVKESLIKDVEDTVGDSEIVGATIRNQLREYAKEELKEKINNNNV